MSAAQPHPAWHIGVIGGSGLAAGIGLDGAQEIEVASPFGLPSSAVTTGSLAGVRFTFLPRHGAGHTIPPSAVNYRANIDALKRCGVTDLVALSAIGSLSPEMMPGHFVAVDQFIDRTTARDGSFLVLAWLPMSAWPIRFARGSAPGWSQQRRPRMRWSMNKAAISPSMARSFRRGPRAGFIKRGVPMSSG